MNREESIFNKAIDVRNSNRISLDKAVFTVATGVLVLSVSYIVGFKDEYLYWMSGLIIAWVFISLCLISHILAYFSAIKETYCITNGINSGKRFFEVEITKKYSCLVRATRILDGLALTFLIIGIVFIIIFSSINLIERNNINRTLELNKYAKPLPIMRYAAQQR